jgi:hypothetical protein
MMNLFKRHEALKIKAKCRLTITDPKTGKVVKVIERKNIIVNNGRYLIGDYLIDLSTVYDVGITYMEIGTGTTTPTITDVALTTYAARKAVTSRTRALKDVTISTFWAAAQCAYNIKEAGEWGNANAAAGQATGQLFSHWLISFDNSAGNYDLTFDYILTIG